MPPLSWRDGFLPESVSRSEKPVRYFPQPGCRSLLCFHCFLLLRSLPESDPALPAFSERLSALNFQWSVPCGWPPDKQCLHPSPLLQLLLHAVPALSMYIPAAAWHPLGALLLLRPMQLPPPFHRNLTERKFPAVSAYTRNSLPYKGFRFVSSTGCRRLCVHLLLLRLR